MLYATYKLSHHIFGKLIDLIDREKIIQSAVE